jgi:putative endonuclease
MKWYVYILECKNRSLYTGITDNLERRLAKHKSGKGGKFTRAFVAKRLLYSEERLTKGNALKRESEIKRWRRKKKLALINGNKKLLNK